MLRNILINIWVIFCPVYWVRNHKTDKKLDSQIKDQLKNPVFSNLEQYTVDLNGVTLWIENYPHAFGNIYPEKKRSASIIERGRLPSRSTQLKLKLAIQEYSNQL